MSGNRTIFKIQQDMANNCGFENKVIWDLLSSQQSYILKNKLKQLIPNQDKGQKAIEQVRELLYKTIWQQRKYTNGNSLSSIIYVFVTSEQNLKSAPESTQFTCHPVFRTRKCLKNGNSSLHCCMIFIDEFGRVYQNWQAYLRNNLLPEGTMIAPQNGVYTFDVNERVELLVCHTPKSNLAHQILKVTDPVSTICGFSAACIPIVAIFTTVSTSLLVGSTVAGVSCTSYAASRSLSNLIDRYRFKQSVALKNRQARNNWLSLVSGIIGVGSTGATCALSAAAIAGSHINAFSKAAVNAINISSITLSGTSVANGVLDLILKYKDDEKVTILDIVQLSASLVLFTNSIYNFTLASQIISQSIKMEASRSVLAANQRHIFQKIVHQQSHLHSNAPTHGDVVRTVNDIPPKHYISDLFKIHKLVSPHSSQTHTGVLQQHQRSHLSQAQPQSQPNTIATTTTAARRPAAANTAKTHNVNAVSMAMVYYQKFNVDKWGKVINASEKGSNIIGNLFSSNGRQGHELSENIFDQECFDNLQQTVAECFTKQEYAFILEILSEFIEKKLEAVQSILRTPISAELILYRILKYILETYVDHSLMNLRLHRENILQAVGKYFRSMSFINQERAVKCKDCDGYYSICDNFY